MQSYSIKKLLLAAALLQIVWGLVPSASKLVIDEIPIELYIAIRWTISGLIFLSLVCASSTWNFRIRKEALWVSLLGIGGYALASFGTLYGLKIGGVTNFALMGALNPIVISTVAIIALKERPVRLFYLALPLCIVGLLLLIIGKHQISSWQVALSSSALIIGAAFLEAIVFVFSRKLKRHFSSIQYLTISQLSAAAFMWFLQLSFFRQTDSIQNLSSRGWIAAVFVSVIACVLCYLVLYWLLNYLDGHRLALFDGLHTLSAALFGFLFFDEIVNGLMGVGGALLLVGLLLGNLPNRSSEKIGKSSIPAASPAGIDK
jgi:drug/metabolite transporter (DMT)-like permease